MKRLLKKRASRVSGKHRSSLTLPGSPPTTSPFRNELPARIWVKVGLGVISTVLLILAIVSPHWMELWLGIAPDSGDGSAEWGVALIWGTIAALMFGPAGWTWRQQVRLLRSA